MNNNTLSARRVKKQGATNDSNQCVVINERPEVMMLLLHGIHGTIADFKRLVPALSVACARTSLFILQPTCNQCDGAGIELLHSKTKDGIKKCAERVLCVVKNVLKTHPDSKYLKGIVVLGHSFGGIYAR